VEEFRQRLCGFCRALFSICRYCDRGQAYCTQMCRVQGYRRARRAARERHQRSEEGRLDHCDRQRAYRARRRAGVTDKGSADCASVGTVTCAAGRTRPQEVSDANKQRCAVSRCIRCGREGRYFRWHAAPQPGWLAWSRRRPGRATT
jgi:hypothetical protein